MAGKIDSAQQVINRIVEDTDSAILFCSLGKDSLVTLDLIYPRFKRIICVFMYFVKGMEHLERWLRWVKARYPNVEIMQIPHWNLSYILRGGLYCTPNPKQKLIKLADTIKAVRLKTGVYYVFLGMKMADGMNRRVMLKGYKDNGYQNRGYVYPLAEWTQKDVLSYMRQHRMPEPVRYGKKASNGAGFNMDFMLWLRERFPEDLKLVLKAFPLAERELWMYDHKENKE